MKKAILAFLRTVKDVFTPTPIDQHPSVLRLNALLQANFERSARAMGMTEAEIKLRVKEITEQR